jgi:molybdenum cofactor cytidylyltransferase
MSDVGSLPHGTDTSSAIAIPRLAAVVLAAGQSSRMRGPNKLLRDFRGKLLLTHALEAAHGAGFAATVVVTGRDRAAVERLAKAWAVDKSIEPPPASRGNVHDHRNINRPTRPAVMLKHNPFYAEGLSTSLIAGIEALDHSIDGAALLLADMPLVTAAHLRYLISAFDRREGRGIVVPTREGRWGNPMLWACRFFAEIKQLRGDRGAKALALEHRNDLLEVEMPDDGILFDIDTEKDFADRPA